MFSPRETRAFWDAPARAGPPCRGMAAPASFATTALPCHLGDGGWGCMRSHERHAVAAQPS
eukprot:2647566-Alexandrium_andersonii.AAC.1